MYVLVSLSSGHRRTESRFQILSHVNVQCQLLLLLLPVSV